MDKTTLLGLLGGILAILLGNFLEGGHISSLLQGTAAIIVFGGTIGAVLVGTPGDDFKLGLKLTRMAFFEVNHQEDQQLVDTVVDLSKEVRKESILALEKRVSSIENLFLKDVVRMVIDGTSADLLREVGEARIDQEEHRMNQGAKIWADAGGFSPTIGIIGAVLGLIHVMANLTDTSKLGAGIAVAFVATVYGVASANLVFLPLANKLKAKVKHLTARREMILEGMVGLTQGLNPVVIEQKMRAYLPVELEDVTAKK